MLFRGVWRRLRGWYQRATGKNPTFLANVRVASGSCKRALVVYLTSPFRPDQASLPQRARHTNVLHCQRIADLLQARGYSVDALHYRFGLGRDAPAYDLIVGLGPHCCDIAERSMGTKIYLATGMPERYTRDVQSRRLRQLIAEHGCSGLRLRPFPDFDIARLRAFNLIAVFGNSVVSDHYKNLGPRIERFNNTNLREVTVPRRDFARARTSFMFMASAGQVLRGLDLLLTAFSQRPDLRLYVCGRFEAEPDFVACFHDQLYATSNVLPVGELVVGSEEYLRVVRDCAFVIYASISEGCPGSVVDCMHAGLIPLLTRESGISLPYADQLIEGHSVEAVLNTVDAVGALTDGELSRRSADVVARAGREFSMAAFDERWDHILDVVDA